MEPSAGLLHRHGAWKVGASHRAAFTRRSTKKLPSCLLDRLPARELDGQQPVGMLGVKRVRYDVCDEDRRLVLGRDFEREVPSRVPRCGQKP